MSDMVRWADGSQGTDAACFLCSNVVGNTVLLSARHERSGRDVDVVACGECGSAWFPEYDEIASPYPDSAALLESDSFWIWIHHYLELVNGLDWKVGMLERLDVERFESVLEVGCNVGVVLDYCRIMWGANVAGLEPSAYGVAGRQLLELPIEQMLMADEHPWTGEQFDLVVSTEVLEHVADPRAFLRDARQLVADDGVLVLTTPRAAALDPSTRPGELYAALSVGAHLFLCSEESLRSLLHDAGFEHVHVEPLGVTHFAVASSRPFELREPTDVHHRLADYHDRSAATARDQRVATGHAISFARFSTLEPGTSAWNELAERVVSAVGERFDLDLRDSDAVLERFDSAMSVAELGTAVPLSLPHFLCWWADEDGLPIEERTERLALAVLGSARALEIDPVNMFVAADAAGSAMWAMQRPIVSRHLDRLADVIESQPELHQLAHLLEPPATPPPPPVSRLQKVWAALPDPVRRVLRPVMSRVRGVLGR